MPSLREQLQSEWNRAKVALKRLDAQTTFVLIAAAALLLLQYIIGEGRFFRENVAHLLPEAWHDLAIWGWWFGMQGVLGFVVPALALILIFGRNRREIGLGLGDWKFALIVAAIYLPIVAMGTWVLSNDPGFQQTYPHYEAASYNWNLFFAYQGFFLLYWIGWEYLWRGFVLFGTQHTFGIYSILIQALPFAVLHYDKPPPEAFLSIVGALVLGAIVWRCRAFWIAVPLHAAQMMLLDLWCTLRVRSGVQGIGVDAFARILGDVLG